MAPYRAIGAPGATVGALVLGGGLGGIIGALVGGQFSKKEDS